MASEQESAVRESEHGAPESEPAAPASPETAPVSDEPARNSFQLLRLLLAVAVLYRHSFDLLATSHADLVLELIPPRTHLGRIALCFFMVISGYLVTQSWLHSDGWRDFLKRRVLRVYPAFVVACVSRRSWRRHSGAARPARIWTPSM